MPHLHTHLLPRAKPIANAAFTIIATCLLYLYIVTTMINVMVLVRASEMVRVMLMINTICYSLAIGITFPWKLSL